MSSTKSVKCKICGKKYVSKDALIGHIEKAHGANIPEGWNAARYENYLRTGKTEGRCVYCGKETGWNNATGKYNRMCGSEACKKKARDLANKNYVGKHGKTYSINDPEQQKKMVYARKNSGKYIFEDEDTGKQYVAMYDSSYGKDFLEMIDTFLNWDGADIIAPSPHTYFYEYEGKKHFYIPDVYSTSLNLEIELKDGGDNPNNHPKIQAVDKVKEQKKDELMASLKDQVNYIKICNKDYSEFFALLSRLKEKDVCQLPKWESKLESISESSIITEASSHLTGEDYHNEFTYYHLEGEKKKHPGGWDEELYYKTIQDAIMDRLSIIARDGNNGKTKYYVYTMGEEYSAIYLGSIIVSWYGEFDRFDPQYEFYWDEVEDISEKSTITEGGIIPTEKINLLKRNKLLKDPMLNYDKLLDYYRKQLFHKNLNQKEWAALYNELLHVRDYLKGVVNNSYSENDQRMEFEAKKALKQVEEFIYYMEQKDTSKLPVVESVSSNKVPFYIVSWDYDSVVGTGVRMITHSKYNHTSIALTPDLEECYTFSRNPEIVKSERTNGFCKESLSYMVRRHGDSEIKVDAVYVSRSAYNKLKNVLDDYIKKGEDTSFDYANFLYSALGIPREELDEDKLNCSVFVDLALKKAGIDLTNGKSSNLVTPKDFAEIDKYHKNIITVYAGKASDYDKKKIGRISMESTLMEVSTVSKIDKDYKPKGNKKLEQFRRVGIDGEFIRKHKDTYKTLKHIDTNDNAVAWMDDKNLVAIAAVDESYDPDGVIKMITVIEVMPEYQGYGLGPQILNYAVRTLKGNTLCVSTKNEVAQKMYKEYGFKYSEASKKLVESGDSKMYMMYYGINMESTIMEACKNVDEARKFVWEVKKIAKKYDANFFLVTDGASGTQNGVGGVSNPAVKHARDEHIKWEKKNGGDPDEDWGSQFENGSYINTSETNEEDIMESYKNDSIFQEIVAFNNELNNFEYIIPATGKLNVSEDDFMKYYKMLTPKEFEKYGGGVCWDYVAYEADYFKRHFPSIKFKSFFVVSINDMDQPTHTFILFDYKGYTYWFEASWKDMHGLYKFKNEKDALDYICKKLREPVRNYKKQYVIEYDPLDKTLFGMSCTEYMDYMGDRLPDKPRVDIDRPKEPLEVISEPLLHDKVYESTFIEAAKDDTLYYPVFIFLSYTGTNMAKLIKAFTHDPYSHSSLSFDTELTNMVSFNREGMVTENIKDGLWKERAGSIKYSLYMYLATAEEYDAMRNFVNELLGKRSKLKYNTLGLTNFIFGRGSEREDKFFCSEFVASVITAGDKKVIKTKPYMTSPYMLAKNKNFKFIKKGLIKNYDPKVVDNIIKDYLEEGGYTNVVIR